MLRQYRASHRARVGHTTDIRSVSAGHLIARSEFASVRSFAFCFCCLVFRILGPTPHVSTHHGHGGVVDDDVSAFVGGGGGGGGDEEEEEEEIVNNEVSKEERGR
eukprot:3425644-Rhodomonas_salina.1